jgi:hypothetical protein
MARKNINFKIEDLNYTGKLKFIFINSIKFLLAINIFLIPIALISSWEDDVEMNWNNIIYFNIYSLFFSLTIIPISNTKIKRLCKIGIISIIIVLMIILYIFGNSKIDKFYINQAIYGVFFYTTIDKLSIFREK